MTMVDTPTSNDPVADLVAEAEGVPATVELRGRTFTYRPNPPMGALSVFASRVADSNNFMRQAAAVPQFLRAWIVPEEHADLEDMMEQVDDLDEFIRVDLVRFVEAVTARPT